MEEIETLFFRALPLSYLLRKEGWDSNPRPRSYQIEGSAFIASIVSINIATLNCLLVASTDALKAWWFALKHRDSGNEPCEIKNGKPKLPACRF